MVKLILLWKRSRQSTYWAESMFRDAWSNLHLGELNVTLGKVLTVESPYFIDTDFIPEAKILKALTYFQLCDYNKVEKSSMILMQHISQ